MALARSMLSYEKQCFGQWQEKVDQIAIQNLKLPILQEGVDGKRYANIHCPFCTSKAQVMADVKGNMIRESWKSSATIGLQEFVTMMANLSAGSLSTSRCS